MEKEGNTKGKEYYNNSKLKFEGEYFKRDIKEKKKNIIVMVN